MRLDGQEKCPIGNGGGHYRSGWTGNGGVITGQRMANYSAFRICMGLFPGWYKLSIGNGGCHYRSKMPDR